MTLMIRRSDIDGSIEKEQLKLMRFGGHWERGVFCVFGTRRCKVRRIALRRIFGRRADTKLRNARARAVV
jgi:hypothetical protein